jgi:hypothetical protein
MVISVASGQYLVGMLLALRLGALLLRMQFAPKQQLPSRCLREHQSGRGLLGICVGICFDICRDTCTCPSVQQHRKSAVEQRLGAA